MNDLRAIQSDFRSLLDFKERDVIALFIDLRAFVLALCPDANELLYHTHALTAVFSVSEKLGDAFCMIPIYSNHLNLGFNKGTLLGDPDELLQGTGNLIRRIPVKHKSDYRNAKVKALILETAQHAAGDMTKPTKVIATTISKIKAK